MGSVHQSVSTIAVLVLYTGEIGDFGPIGDCYSPPCIANRGDMEVWANR